MSKEKQKANKNSHWIWWIILLLAVLLIGVMVAIPGGKNHAEVLPLEVNTTRAFELKNAGAFFLDVREPSEWNERHIPGSTLIPLGELASRVIEVPADQMIVVVCRSGNRSQSGRDILLAAGFTQVTSMSGGINQWQTSGYPITTGP